LSPQNLAVLVEVYPIHQRVKAAVKYSSEQHTVRHKLRHLEYKAVVKHSKEQHTVRHKLRHLKIKCRRVKAAVRSIQSDPQTQTPANIKQKG
jgi:predicted transcriptional regulator